MKLTSKGFSSYAKVFSETEMDDILEIAKTKMPDLNAASLETAMSMVEGTARSMGVVVKK